MKLHEFTNPIEVGDPYKMGEVVGRVVGFDKESACFDGQYALVLFSTPHGNVFKTGRFHIEKIASDEDLAKLKGFEEDAAAKGIEYNYKKWSA